MEKQSENDNEKEKLPETNENTIENVRNRNKLRTARKAIKKIRIRK